MKVKGMSFQISGYQTAFRINVSDFGYSESEKLKFINDLLVGRIDKEDLISRVTATQQEAVECRSLSSQDSPCSGSATETDCKLQGVFVGSVEAVNSFTDDFQTDTSVYMIPISSRRNSQPQTDLHKPKLIVNSLYEQLQRNDISIVKGELHCSMRGSQLHLPLQENLASSSNNFDDQRREKHNRHSKAFTHNFKRNIPVVKVPVQKKGSRHPCHDHSGKHHYKQQNTQSIQPGLVRRLCEIFSGDDTASVRSSAPAKCAGDASEPNNSKSCQITYEKKCKNHSMVDTAVNTDNSYLATKKKLFQRGSCSRSPNSRYFSNSLSLREKHENKQAQGDQETFRDGIRSNKSTNKALLLVDVPAPSTGNSFAYQYWESDNDYDGIEYEEVEPKQAFAPHLESTCKENPFNRSPCYYEVCPACSEPVYICRDSDTYSCCSYCDEKKKNRYPQSKFPINTCCCPICIRHLNKDIVGLQQSVPKKSNLDKTVELKQLSKLKESRARKYENEHQKSNKGRFHDSPKKENGDQHVHTNRSNCSTSKRAKPQHLCDQASAVPRCVDFVEYPFCGSSTSDYVESEEIAHCTSTAVSTKKPSGQKNHLRWKKNYDSGEDSILNFEDLKKENKKFTSLRKEFPQRHDAFDLEDSDDSHASVNQEKLAYEARVRSYTRAPPVPEAKTSLNSIDIARINNFANDGYPQLSAGCHQPEVPHPSGRSLKKRVTGSKISHRRQSLSQIPITRKSIFTSASIENYLGSGEKDQDDEASLLPSLNNDEKHIHPRHSQSKLQRMKVDYEREREVTRDCTTSKKGKNIKQLISKNRVSLSEVDNDICIGSSNNTTSKNFASFDQAETTRKTCTPSQLAIRSAQECPTSLKRREWEVDDINFRGPQFALSASTATVKPSKCNKKTGS